MWVSLLSCKIHSQARLKVFCLILFMPSNVDNGKGSTIKMLRIMVKVMVKFSVLVLMTTTKTVM